MQNHTRHDDGPRNRREAKAKAPPVVQPPKHTKNRLGPRKHRPTQAPSQAGEPSDVTETAERSSGAQDTGLHCRSTSTQVGGAHVMQYSAGEPPAQNHPHPPLLAAHRNLKTQLGRRPQKEERESGDSWSCASRQPPPPSAPPPRPYPSPRPAVARLLPPPFAASQLEVRPGPGPSLALYLTRCLCLACSDVSTSGWRCASAAVPDPVSSEEPTSASASYTVVVTDKPDTPADDKVEVVSAAPSGSAEAPVAELVSSEASPSPSPDDGGLDEILSKVSPCC